MLFLGIDIGSSSVKLAVLDGQSGRALASTQYPDQELPIHSPLPGWAEQDPQSWWDCVKKGCERLAALPGVDLQQVTAIGISYQMHGLVLVDSDQRVLRPAIIWCDSRAVPMGEQALAGLGEDYCFDHLLNSPGNFTGAKLRWVQENEPELFARIHKLMLPGDYVAMRLTGEITTTASGLSEGTLWDFRERSVARHLLAHWGVAEELVPRLVPSIGEQGRLSAVAAAELGLKAGASICYRGGDQPNNAYSLNVLNPGEVAATAGTSGVIYGVTDKPVADRNSRVNTFLHVSDTPEQPRNGVLLCVNGTGRLYSWLRHMLAEAGEIPAYPVLNGLAEAVPPGSDGLRFYPFGNGAERIFQNRNPGAQVRHLDFNRHGLGHMVRAAQEGIVFALNQGFEVLKELGAGCDVIRVARGNMFLSDVFTQAFVNTTGTVVEFYDTDGAEGAARAAALGAGHYRDAVESFAGLQRLAVVEPRPELAECYQASYRQWAAALPSLMEG